MRLVLTRLALLWLFLVRLFCIAETKEEPQGISGFSLSFCVELTSQGGQHASKASRCLDCQWCQFAT